MKKGEIFKEYLERSNDSNSRSREDIKRELTDKLTQKTREKE